MFDDSWAIWMMVSESKSIPPAAPGSETFVHVSNQYWQGPQFLRLTVVNHDGNRARITDIDKELLQSSF
jgi:hypothetical protein